MLHWRLLQHPSCSGLLARRGKELGLAGCQVMAKAAGAKAEEDASWEEQPSTTESRSLLCKQGPRYEVCED